MLDEYNNVYITGIKGVAMANLAVILKKTGKTVNGCDTEEEFITDTLLKSNNISWQTGFDGSLPEKTDLVVYSEAHLGTHNPKVLEEKKKGVKIMHQAELLGAIMKEYRTSIAVCGCHGKTTTSSLLTYVLLTLGAAPSYLVGAPTFNGYNGGDHLGKEYFVVEADEYGINPPANKTPKFHFLKPSYILCTNIDYDHPDVYTDLSHVKAEFLKFFNGRKLILSSDDENTVQLIEQLDKSLIKTYGFSKDSNLTITNPVFNTKGSSFNLSINSGKKRVDLGAFNISLYGDRNILNAAGVILVLLELGFDPEKIKSAITNFTGAKRRFENIFQNADFFLFDDYAPHPKEIEATIHAARGRFPKRRIIVIFQPHTYSRTQALCSDFAKALSLADLSLILPIFASARENPKNFKVASSDIVALNPNKLAIISSKDELISYLLSQALPQDIIFTMGAGDVYKLKDDIIRTIKSLS